MGDRHSPDEFLMFGGRSSSVNGRNQLRQVTAKQCTSIQPKAGEDFAFQDAVWVGRHGLVAAVAQAEEIDGHVFDAPDDVFGDAGGGVDFALVVGVDVDGGGGDFEDE